MDDVIYLTLIDSNVINELIREGLPHQCLKVVEQIFLKILLQLLR